MRQARSRWAIAAAMCVTFWMGRGPALAEVQITWANEVLFDAKQASPAKNALGPPDAKLTGISGSSFIYVRFRGASPQAYTGLGAQLGQPLGEPKGKLLSDQDLKGWDIIAFEGKPGVKGWESSIWFITDMKHAAAGSFSEGKSTSSSSPLRYLTGKMTAASYNKYFNITGQGATATMGWILIDIPNAPNVPEGIVIKPDEFFRIWASGAEFPEGPDGTPDPDAIGFINH